MVETINNFLKGLQDSPELRAQIKHIAHLSNWGKACQKYMGDFIIYNGPLIPEYEENNMRVHNNIKKETKRLDSLVA